MEFIKIFNFVEQECSMHEQHQLMHLMNILPFALLFFKYFSIYED